VNIPEALKQGLNRLPVSRLLFDKENPRYPDEIAEYTEDEMLQYFESGYNLLPIARSMVDNGYFEEEPLVGIPGPDNKAIVVEGNRRLAALKFLTKSKARAASKKPDLWNELSTEAEKKGTMSSLLLIPVVIHNDREEVRGILGFRHITGIKKWNAFMKARFINRLIETREGATLSGIAREVGAWVATIRNNYVAYRVYLQAKDDFSIDTSKAEKEFGVFYTALTDPNIKSYLAIDLDKDLHDLKKPIIRSKSDELRFLIEWLHGTNEIEPIITDSRQIRRFGEILVSAQARKALQVTRNFEYAFRLTGGEKRALLTNLEMADMYLTEAYKTVYRYGKDPVIKNLVRKCQATVEQMLRSLPDVEKGLTATS